MIYLTQESHHFTKANKLLLNFIRESSDKGHWIQAVSKVLYASGFCKFEVTRT